MNTFSITDLDGFAFSVRDGAARSISENYTENLDEYITINQIKKIIQEKQVGYDSENLPMITEDIFDDIFFEITSTIYQVGLSKLAAKDKIECAWDSDLNEMVFWIKTKDNVIKSINSLPSE